MYEHKYVDMDEVRNNPDKPWNKFWLSGNKQLTVKDIDTLVLPNSKRDWDWGYISANITIQEVRNNQNKPWNKTGLSQNKQLTVKDIETLILPNSKYNWNWYGISECISINEIINNPHKPWSRDLLQDNKGLTDKILEFFDASLLKHLQKHIPKFKYHTDILIKCEY